MNISILHQLGSVKLKLGTALIGLVIAAICLWLATREVDMNTLRESLQNTETVFILPFVISLSLFYLLKVHRWRSLMPEHIQIHRMSLATPMMVGFACNNLLPFRIGELVRIALAGKFLSAPKTLILGTIVSERLFDIIAIASIFVAGIIYTAFYNDFSDSVNKHVLISIFLIVTTAVIFILFQWLSRLDHETYLKLFPVRWHKHATQLILNFTSGLVAVKGKKQLAFILINSLLQWMLVTLCIYFSIAAFSTESSDYSIAAVVLGFLVLGVTLPSAPAFIGTIEYAFVFSLGLFGEEPASAISIAIFYHVLSFLYVVATACICVVCFWVSRIIWNSK